MLVVVRKHKKLLIFCKNVHIFQICMRSASIQNEEKLVQVVKSNKDPSCILAVLIVVKNSGRVNVASFINIILGMSCAQFFCNACMK